MNMLRSNNVGFSVANARIEYLEAEIKKIKDEVLLEEQRKLEESK
jgi:hypothetical protein